MSQKHISIQKLELEIDQQKQLLAQNMIGKEQLKHIQQTYDLIMKEKQDLIKIQDDIINQSQKDIKYQERKIEEQHQELLKLRRESQ